MTEKTDKRACLPPAVSLSEMLNVTVEYAREHTEELLERVNSENMAVIIWDTQGAVVLVPYWWHVLAFGTDAKQIIMTLFEVSKEVIDAEILKIEGIAQGYIILTAKETAQEILDTLLRRLGEHPYADHWRRVLDKLTVYWNEENQPEVVMARFSGDRKVNLLFSDGRTRQVDM